MRVVIDPEVMEDEPSFAALDVLSVLFQSGRHRWIDADTTEVMKSAWARGVGARHQSALRQLLRSSGASAPFGRRNHDVRIRLKPARPQELKPQLACEWLSMPLQIIVEDPEGHGALLDRVLLDLDPPELDRAIGQDEARQLCDRWRPKQGDGRFFSVLPGGGRDVGNELRRKATPLPGRPPDPIFVVVDSDRRYRGEAIRAGSTAAGATEQAARLVAPPVGGAWEERVHVLYKREVENYIPATIIHEQVPQRGAREAWSRLTEEQRDHLSLKSGLAKDLARRGSDLTWHGVPVSDWAWAVATVRELWNNLDQPAAEALLPALGLSASRAFHSDSWERNTATHLSSLRDRDGRGELPKLLETLISLL